MHSGTILNFCGKNSKNDKLTLKLKKPYKSSSEQKFQINFLVTKLKTFSFKIFPNNNY